MPTITFDPQKCHKDGICSAVCPTKFIRGSVGEFPEAQTGKHALCIDCGQCIAFCPHNAITHSNLDNDLALPIDYKAMPSAASVELLCKSRRSIRAFEATQVPKDCVEKILSATFHAPTAKNSRVIRYIMLYEKQSIIALGDCIATCLEDNARNAPNNQVIPEGAALAGAWRKGYDALFRSAPHLVLAICPKDWVWNAQDSSIALSYFELTAHAHGVGCCWAGYITAAASAYEPVQKMLQLQENEVVCGGQMFGFPRFRPKRLAPRAPLPVTWI